MNDEQKALLDPGLRWIAEQGAQISLGEYTQALEARAELIAKMNAFHQRYDVLVSPMLPLVAFGEFAVAIAESNMANAAELTAAADESEGTSFGEQRAPNLLPGAGNV